MEEQAGTIIWKRSSPSSDPKPAIVPVKAHPFASGFGANVDAAEHIAAGPSPLSALSDGHDRDADPPVAQADADHPSPTVSRTALTARNDQPPRRTRPATEGARGKRYTVTSQGLALVALLCLVLVLSGLVLVLTVRLVQKGDQASISPSGARPSTGDPGSSDKDASGPTPDATPGPTGTGGTDPAPTQGIPRFELESLSFVGQPFETIPIRGTYIGAPAGTSIRVQRRGDDGGWVDFPLPAATDENGQFNAFVELGSPGRYRLRISDPARGVVSDVAVLRIG
jgi:hypothetical protein